MCMYPNTQLCDNYEFKRKRDVIVVLQVLQ